LWELRSGPRSASREWRRAVEGLQVRLSPEQMDAWLRRRFLEVLRSSQVAVPCPVSAVYGASRQSPAAPLSSATARQLGEGHDGPDAGSADLPQEDSHLVDWRPDVRHSSYRTLARLVKVLGKEGSVTTKEMRKELYIVAVKAA